MPRKTLKLLRLKIIGEMGQLLLLLVGQSLPLQPLNSYLPGVISRDSSTRQTVSSSKGLNILIV